MPHYFILRRPYKTLKILYLTPKIVKVICEKCGLEYVIFDNYKHGYDATFIEAKEDFLNDVEPKNFKKTYPQSLEVYIKIYQEFSYNQFKNEFENVNYDSYLNSFSNIDIYGTNSKKKKIKICLEETA